MAYGRSMELDTVWRPNPAVTARAVERARSVLNGTETATHLKNYYTSANDYAGSTFLDLEPNDPYQVSPADLLAVTTLSVSIHPPRDPQFRHQQQQPHLSARAIGSRAAARGGRSIHRRRSDGRVL